jgi:hypothetical protein
MKFFSGNVATIYICEYPYGNSVKYQSINQYHLHMFCFWFSSFAEEDFNVKSLQVDGMQIKKSIIHIPKGFYIKRKLFTFISSAPHKFFFMCGLEIQDGHQ